MTIINEDLNEDVNDLLEDYKTIKAFQTMDQIKFFITLVEKLNFF